MCVAAMATFGVPARVEGQTAAAREEAGTKRAEQALKLTPEEERLVESSRAAIIETGFSAGYFDAHFEPFRVFNTPGDRRVMWRFRVNEYEVLINDPIGFYTDARGQRVDTHSVAATLGKTRDIRRTISLRRAERVMKTCIGEHGSASILFQRFGAEGRAALVFTAVSLLPLAAPANASQPAPAITPDPTTSRRRDGLRPGGKKKPFLVIGTVDLETGRCTKGVAQVGSPQPQPVPPTPKRPRRRS